MANERNKSEQRTADAEVVSEVEKKLAENALIRAKVGEGRESAREGRGGSLRNGLSADGWWEEELARSP